MRDSVKILSVSILLMVLFFSKGFSQTAKVYVDVLNDGVGNTFVVTIKPFSGSENAWMEELTKGRNAVLSKVEYLEGTSSFKVVANAPTVSRQNLLDRVNSVVVSKTSNPDK